MVLTRKEKMELERLKKLTKGSRVKVTRVGPANVRISGFGTPVVKQLGTTTGLSARTVARAKLRLSRKR